MTNWGVAPTASRNELNSLITQMMKIWKQKYEHVTCKFFKHLQLLRLGDAYVNLACKLISELLLSFECPSYTYTVYQKLCRTFIKVRAIMGSTEPCFGIRVVKADWGGKIDLWYLSQVWRHLALTRKHKLEYSGRWWKQGCCAVCPPRAS